MPARLHHLVLLNNPSRLSEVPQYSALLVSAPTPRGLNSPLTISNSKHQHISGTSHALGLYLGAFTLSYVCSWLVAYQGTYIWCLLPRLVVTMTICHQWLRSYAAPGVRLVQPQLHEVPHCLHHPNIAKRLVIL
jgi:hypothetical protein